MADTAADILIETLHDWGVEVVFGLPGDGINGIMEALRKRQDEIRFVQVRHEEAAAFMACGYAKFTGQARRLPRHLRPGRHPSAQRPLRRQAGRRSPCSRSPGMHYHDLIGTHAQQDVDLDSSSWTSRVYNQRVMGPATSRTWPTWPAARRSPTGAWRTSPSRSTCRSRQVGRSARKRNVPATPRTSARAARAPARRRRSRAARPTILNAGKKVAILAGQGALRRDRRARAAGRARWPRPIVKALLGKAAVPDDSPYTTGGDRPARHAAVAGGAGGVRHAADGRHAPSRTSSSTRSRARRAPCRSTSIPCAIGLRYPVEVGLVGDSRRTLQALLPLLDAEARPRRSWSARRTA